MKIEICHVSVGIMTGTQAEAKTRAQRAPPGEAWRGEERPDNSVVIRTLNCSDGSLVPSWAYTFWRAA